MAAGGDLEFRLLGPFEVLRGGVVLPIGSPRQRAVLALLVLHRGHVVSVDAIAAELWGEAPPPSATVTVQSLVSRLRTALGGGPHLIRAQRPGYILQAATDMVDAARFAALADAGRQAAARGDHLGAAGHLTAALGLWRGPALADLREPTAAAAEAHRLDQARLAALEDLADAELAAGRAAAALARLEPHVGDEPLRERAWGQVMLALYRLGRQADALRAYQQARSALARQVGLEPTPALRDLQRRILCQDVSLELEAPATASRGSGLDARPIGNLTNPLTALVGRRAELETLNALLPAARALTLAGPGGVGKTRLALALASANQARFPDGVWVVDLAPLREPEQIPAEVAGTIGLSTGGLRSPAGLAAELAALLEPRQMLLVLDNCEHLVEGTAQLTEALLSRCPGMHVLATSREILGLPGEVVWPVPPLAVPPEDVDDPALVGDSDAVALFCARAAAARPGFGLSHANARHVVTVCRRLDGLPLAIELAAVRTRALSVGQIAAQLADDRFGPLAGNVRTVADRQRTLRATFDWSHRLLPPADQVALRRLAAFPASFDLAAARSVVTAPAGEGPPVEEASVLDRLTGLIERSWLAVRHDDAAGTRYRLLETVRQYAAERLAAAGEAFSTHRRHRDLYLQTALGAGVCWFDDAEASALVNREAENLRAALEFSVREGDAEPALSLAATLAPYWLLTSKVEGIEWLERALDCPGPVAVPARAEAWTGLGMVLANALDGEHGRAEECLLTSRQLALQLGLTACASRALALLGERALFRGDTARARELFNACLAEWEDIDAVSAGWCELYLGEAALTDGDVDAALAHLERARPGATAGGLLGPQVWAALAPLYAQRGRPDEACRLAEAAISSARDYPLPTLKLTALGRAAQTRIMCGDPDGAAAAASELIATLKKLGCWHWVADALDITAVLAGRAGRPGDAARLLAAGQALRTARGERPIAGGILAVPVAAAGQEAARNLGPDACAAAEAVGHTFGVTEALRAAATALRHVEILKTQEGDL